MRDAHPTKWESEWGASPWADVDRLQPTAAALQWWRVLAELPRAWIARGIHRCESDTSRANERGEIWPPSPLEFKALAQPRPEELGLPPELQAYDMACAGDWSVPAVYEAARRVGTYELRHQPRSKTWGLFRRAWADVTMEAAQGAVFVHRTTAPAIASDRPPAGRPLGPEEARRRLEEAKAVAAGIFCLLPR